MKRTVKVIVGANYGDEGKGLATDYFSRRDILENKNVLNVLYNGGPQRGHTVEIEGRLRHIFHHFGSGTFAGADTYFDMDFMVNPMEFVKEATILEQEGVTPTCYIHPECRVTTPFDMIINHIVEDARGELKHGSCGMGIWETEQRYLLDTKKYTWGELASLPVKSIRIYLEYLRNVYVPQRLEWYNVRDEDIFYQYKDTLKNDGLIDHYISDLLWMKEHVINVNTVPDFDSYHDSIIFEGAQGLALDAENVDEYPHVTASRTGSYIPISRCNYDDDIEVVYITRSYFTRHGEGEFTSCPVADINKNIVDHTNLYNYWQGNIRYGKFDYDSFQKRIDRDVNLVKGHSDDIKRSLFVTHLNYTAGDICGDTTVSDLHNVFRTVYLSYDRFGKDVRILNKQ